MTVAAELIYGSSILFVYVTGQKSYWTISVPAASGCFCYYGSVL
jgi:hypothetical protein